MPDLGRHLSPGLQKGWVPQLCLFHPLVAFNALSHKSVSACAVQSVPGTAPTSRCTGHLGIGSYYLWARVLFSLNLALIILVHSGPAISLLLSSQMVLLLNQNASDLPGFSVLSVARREASDPGPLFSFEKGWEDSRGIFLNTSQIVIWKRKHSYLCQEYLNFLSSKASSVIQVQLTCSKGSWFFHLWYL